MGAPLAPRRSNFRLRLEESHGTDRTMIRDTRHIHFRNPRRREKIHFARIEGDYWVIPDLANPWWRIHVDRITVDENGDLHVTGPCPWT